MASWGRRRGSQVCVYYRDSGRPRVLARAETRHLDAQSDSNIDHWVAQWELKRNPNLAVVSDEQLTKLVDRYVAHQRLHGMAEGTYAEHRRHLLGHVIPYFLRHQPPLVNPGQWEGAAPRMYQSLREKELTDSQIFRCNVALRKFYSWLREEQEVLPGPELVLRGPPRSRTKHKAQLRTMMTPDEVLSLARSEQDNDYRRILLLGYFLSLRPQELFGLRVGDIRIGNAVYTLESAKAMRDLGLYGGLVVNVRRQKTKKSAIVEPKSGSGGWVACFNREAARLLVESLGALGPDVSVVERSPNKVYREWKHPFELKDLRRASLYWLGHHTSVGPNQLMKHARHVSFETTQIYLRRPDEELAVWTGLNVADI